MAFFRPASISDTMGRLDVATDPKIAKQNAKSEKARRAAVNMTKKMYMTQELIGSKIDDLISVMDSDDQAARIIEAYEKATTKQIDEIASRIVSGQAVSGDDMKMYLDSQQALLQAVEGSSQIFEVSLNDLVESYKAQLLNDSLDGEERKAVLDELSRLMEAVSGDKELSQQQLDAMKELGRLSKTGVDISLDQARNLGGVLNELKDSDITSFKMKGTIDEISRHLETVMMDNKDFQDTMEKNMGDGSLKDMLSNMGLDDATSSLKGGLINLLLAQFGLGGLGIGEALSKGGLKSIKGFFSGIIGKVKGFFSGIASFISKFKISNIIKSVSGVFGKVTGVFSKISSVFSSIGKFFKPITSIFSSLSAVSKAVTPFASILGKVVLPIGVAISAIEALFNFMNASDIAGKPEEAITLFDRINAVISGFISSLTLGFVDAKDIFNKINSAVEAILNFGRDAYEVLKNTTVDAKTKLVDAVVGMWDNLIGGVTDFVSTIWDKIKTFFSSLIDEGILSLGKNLLSGWFDDKETEKEGKTSGIASFFGFGNDEGESQAKVLPTTVGKPIPGSVEAEKLVDSMAQSEKQRNLSMDRLREAMMKAPANAPSVVPLTSGGKPAMDKSTTIDDYGIALTNSLVFGS